ncbi:MAG: pirin-like C-terminal cupin domain-containing protein [Flavobacteriales bacterium]
MVRLLLFGGESFPETRHIRWNFVSSSKEKFRCCHGAL